MKTAIVKREYAMDERLLHEVIAMLGAKQVIDVPDIQKEHFDGLDLVVAIGGDGTLLRTARYLTDIPIIGINPFLKQSEGALCTLNAENIYLLDDILQGDYDVVKRTRAQGFLNGEPIPQLALNEFSIGKKYDWDSADYIITYNGHSERQRGNGVLVCTGTGSHARNKNEGGFVFDPTANALKYLSRGLIKSRIFTPTLIEGMITSEESIVIECLKRRDGAIAIDSNKVYEFNRSDKIEVKVALHPLICLQPRINDSYRS